MEVLIVKEGESNLAVECKGLRLRGRIGEKGYIRK
jgi:hypothetical protein